ncbi:MAG: hypothetical protein ACTHMA_22035 [Thermomicrobiales bacterium]
MSTESERYQPAVDDVVIRENVVRTADAPRMTSDAAVTGMTTAPARDLVHWGPAWTGVLTSFAIFVTLDLLITAIGWITATTRGAAATGATIWWMAVLGAISFFIGGWLAQTTASVRGAGSGLLTGFVVWALGAAVIAAVSMLGAGMAGSPLAGMIGATTPVAGNLRGAALDGFIFLIVTLIAACIGGIIGNQMPFMMNRTPMTTRRMQAH